MRIWQSTLKCCTVKSNNVKAVTYFGTKWDLGICWPQGPCKFVDLRDSGSCWPQRSWEFVDLRALGICWPQGSWELLTSGALGICWPRALGICWPQGPWEFVDLRGSYMRCRCKILKFILYRIRAYELNEAGVLDRVEEREKKRWNSFNSFPFWPSYTVGSLREYIHSAKLSIHTYQSALLSVTAPRWSHSLHFLLDCSLIYCCFAVSFVHFLQCVFLKIRINLILGQLIRMAYKSIVE